MISADVYERRKTRAVRCYSGSSTSELFFGGKIYLYICRNASELEANTHKSANTHDGNVL